MNHHVVAQFLSEIVLSQQREKPHTKREARGRGSCIHHWLVVDVFFYRNVNYCSAKMYFIIISLNQKAT